MIQRDRLNHAHPAPAVDAIARRGMCISVVSGIGTGQTGLSAFDDALWRCGAHNYNLIPLSSVIPTAATIAVVDRHAAPRCEFGHKLYVVKAEMRSVTPGAVIAAGLGWYQWGDGHGVFVEHEIESHFGLCGSVRTELSNQISASLRDLAARRDAVFAEELVGSRIEVTQIGQIPACALVLAVYESEGWRVHGSDNGMTVG